MFNSKLDAIKKDSQASCMNVEEAFVDAMKDPEEAKQRKVPSYMRQTTSGT